MLEVLDQVIGGDADAMLIFLIGNGIVLIVIDVAENAGIFTIGH